MDDFIMFESEEYGFKKEQVVAYITKMHKKYRLIEEKYQEQKVQNKLLEKKVKSL